MATSCPPINPHNTLLANPIRRCYRGAARKPPCFEPLDAHAELGEGPTWHAAEAVLVWVDITRHLVHRYNPATGRDESIDVGQHVGAAAPRAAGGLVLALRDGFGILDTASGRVEMIADIEADHPGNRMNDGKCDSAGRFWAGTMAYDNRPGAGALYRLEPDHHVVKVLSDV